MRAVNLDVQTEESCQQGSSGTKTQMLEWKARTIPRARQSFAEQLTNEQWKTTEVTVLGFTRPFRDSVRTRTIQSLGV